ncbi:hypothetical protein EYF80_028288 [Liparis tanakae]|uniref:Uncharacterized protein n=1 Tax=Liparis tanakae TaxID=230148 RepID=A0A4Z2H921_9TELE|nr:hypothetical protein EYF80_028288 [Liparis tanakae]
MLLKVPFLPALDDWRMGMVTWPTSEEEGRDTLRYHRALAQQTTVSKYKQETFEGIAGHSAGVRRCWKRRGHAPMGFLAAGGRLRDAARISVGATEGRRRGDVFWWPPPRRVPSLLAGGAFSSRLRHRPIRASLRREEEERRRRRGETERDRGEKMSIYFPPAAPPRRSTPPLHPAAPPRPLHPARSTPPAPPRPLSIPHYRAELATDVLSECSGFEPFYESQKSITKEVCGASRGLFGRRRSLTESSAALPLCRSL